MNQITTMKEINEFIETKLKGNNSLKISEMQIDNFDELSNLFIATAMSSRADATYEVEFLDKEVQVAGCTTEDFIVTRRQQVN